MINPASKTAALVPFTVLGGYLGAGKTTLLNRLLQDNTGRRIALLINDFGAINIDAQLIESESDQQINLTNGCICCGLSDGFDEAIAGLLASDTPPEHIVVEASGVADIRSLAQYGKTPGLTLDAILVVADALNVKRQATDKYVANTIKRQLAAADLLLLNKADLVTPVQLEELKNWLETLSNNAPVIGTEFCILPEALLLGTGSAHQRVGQAAVLPDEHDHRHAHTERYVTWQYTLNQPLTENQIEEFLAKIPAGVLRGKGFFGTATAALEWHQVGKQQRLTARSDTQTGTTTLVAIGLNAQLNPADLDVLAATYLAKPQDSAN